MANREVGGFRAAHVGLECWPSVRNAVIEAKTKGCGGKGSRELELIAARYQECRALPLQSGGDSAGSHLQRVRCSAEGTTLAS